MKEMIYLIVKKRQVLLNLSLVFLVLIIFTGSAAPVNNAAGNKAFVQKVFNRLISVIDDQDPSWDWPPEIVIEETNDINAWAQQNGSDNNFRVTVTTAILDYVIQGKEDRLAFILGHELSHITRGHCSDHTKFKSKFEKLIFDREQEIEADVSGMAYALAAGYSFKKGSKVVDRMIELGLDYSSFEGMSVNHPSWADRIPNLDKERETLWRSMSAFKNGNYLLVIEQYDAAASCFRYVSNEFRDCFEAYNNLGYALLMKYADALDPADIKNFNIGHLLTGGFYKRPGSIAVERAMMEDVWWEAVGALNEALKLNENATLALTNLGIAYLIKPGDQDLAKAYKYFDLALTNVQNDPDLDPLSKAYVYINTGAAYVFDNEINKSLDLLSKAETESAIAATEDPGNASMSNSILYNRALISSRSSNASTKRNSVNLFEQFLTNSSSVSNWWKVAYSNYTDICSQLRLTPKSESSFKSTGKASFRIVSTVKLKNGESIALSTPVDELTERLGQAQIIPVASKTNIQQLSYPQYGVEVLALKNVLAIMVKGNNAPAVEVQQSGLGGEANNVYIGMPKAELNDLLGMDYVPTRIIGKKKKYRYYQNIGLAIMVKSGKIKEIVLAQI